MSVNDIVAGNERPVNIGGLMRCCLETIAENDQPSAVGDQLPCRWCDHSAIVNANGAWQWLHPARGPS